MVKGLEFHSIIQNIFTDIRGINELEQIQINCPRCQERDYLSQPDGKFNLEINTRKQVFRCWKCDEPKFSGSLGKLIKIFGTSADYELYKSYAGNFFDYDEDDEDDDNYRHVQLPQEFILFSDLNTNNSDHMNAYNYLVFDRKLTFNTLLKYKLGFCVDGKYGGRIIIPSYDIEGDLNYFVARTYKGEKPPYINPKVDKNNIIFNESYLKWDSTIFIVEGVFEMFSLINTTPLLGKTLPTALFNVLKSKKPQVVIILDPDAYKISIEIFQTILAIYVGEEHKVRIVKLTGDKDLDEIRREYGRKKIIKILYTARQLTVDDYFFFNKHKKYDTAKKRFGTYNQNKRW